MIASPLCAPAQRAVLVAAALMCALAHARADVTITDAGGRQVEVTDTSRIVSIGGDVTEILYALKAEGKIVAVDSTSQFPADALKEKTNVGYMRALSAEGVLSTNPSLIIAAKDAGPPDVVALLKASSVPYVEVPDDHTPEGVAAKIRFIASVVGADAAGDALAKDVERDFALLAEQRAKITQADARAVRAHRAERPRDRRRRHTSADAIIRLAGAENAAAGIDGYKPLADEAAIELAPDAIVTMRHSSSTLPLRADPRASRACRRARPGSTTASSRWTGSISSASGRAARAPRAIS